MTFSSPPTGGTLAHATATIGGVTGTTMTNNGAGYTVATVTFSAPSGGGILATGTANIVGGQIASITLTGAPLGGGLYTSNPTITITGDGLGATATAVAGVGMVTNITFTNNGAGYVDGAPIPATIFLTLAGNGISYGPFTLIAYDNASPVGGSTAFPYAGTPCGWTANVSINVASTAAYGAVTGLMLGIFVFWHPTYAGWYLYITFGGGTGTSTTMSCANYPAMPAPVSRWVSSYPSFIGPINLCTARPWSTTVIPTPGSPAQEGYTIPVAENFFYELFGGYCTGGTDNPTSFPVTFTLSE